MAEESTEKVFEKLDASPGTPFSPSRFTSKILFNDDHSDGSCQLVDKLPNALRLKDKIVFTYSVLSVVLSGYLFAFNPRILNFVYAVKFVLYFGLRFLNYRSENYHYFMLDFCYYANALLMVHLFIFPDSKMLAQVCYAFALGPLASAIWAWHNALVFHSIDKMSSVYMHFYPACVCIHNRWWKNGRHDFSLYDPTASYASLVLIPTAFYLLWQVIYAAKVYVLDKEKIEADPTLQFSFRYMTANQKGGAFKIANILGPKYRIPVYCAAQFLYTFVTLQPVLIWYNHGVAATVFCLLMFAIGVWNGAGYYIEYFAKKYLENQREKEQGLKNLAAALEQDQAVGKKTKFSEQLLMRIYEKTHVCSDKRH